jgi:hypothetical protein
VHQRAKSARITTLHVLASPRAELGSLDRVRSVLKVFGMRPGFNQTPCGIEVEETGRHARTAVGMAEQPLDIAWRSRWRRRRRFRLSRSSGGHGTPDR